MMSFPSAETSTIPHFADIGKAGNRAGSRSHSIAGGLLLATLLAAPLAFGSVETWAWATLAVLAVLLLFLWGAGCAQQGTARLLWSPLYLPAGLLVLLGILQFFGHRTMDPIGTREALLKLVTDLSFFFLAGQLWIIGSTKTFRAFGLVVTVYAFLLSLVTIVQFFSGSEFNYWNYWQTHSQYGAIGSYVNRNHYAGLMEMLVPLAAAYVLSLPKSHPQRRLLGISVLLPIVSALLTGSRGGFISLLAEIVILGVVLFNSGAISGRRNLLTVGALGLTAAAILFFWIDPGQISKRLIKVFDLTNSSDVSYGNRGIVALDSLHIFLDHPWIGSGMGSFETVYPSYQSLPGDYTWEHAHNDYAEALAETGLVGGLLILVALVMFFGFAFKNLGARLDQPGGWIQLGATIGCCGLLIHSFFDFNLHIPANAAWFAVCCGISLGAVNFLKRERPVRTYRAN